MALTIETGLTTLKTVFDKVDEVYYRSTEILQSELAADIAMDLELPVLEDGVTFDTGEPDVANIKLTTGANWVTSVTAGDADISFQVASVNGAVNELLMETIASIDSTAALGSNSYSGGAFAVSRPKKITGALFMQSASKDAIIILPYVEAVANLVVNDGDNPAYFNVHVTPQENSDGSDLFILYRDTETE